MHLRRICVFCGSSVGGRPEYSAAAEALGRVLVQRGLGLVYGGGNIGLMGVVARTVHEGGGEVIGVIPEALLRKEVGYTELPDLRVVPSMHERKALMATLADAFIAMPGGVGTLEEFFEVVTWVQLGIHRKPCGLLNVCGYFDHLLAFLTHTVTERFLKPQHHGVILTADRPEVLLDQFFQSEIPVLEKWLDRSQT